MAIGVADLGDIGVKLRRQHPPAGKFFELEGYGHGGRTVASFKLADMTLALQSKKGGESLQRQAKLFTEIGDCHGDTFAHGKRTIKREVRSWLNDTSDKVSHNANMPRSNKIRTDLYEGYRQASGWYLAAWRDYRNLTLEELADEIGSSKGYISDLETGAARPDRPIRRFNRDLMESIAKELNTTGGRLVDVNPFTMAEGHAQLSDDIAKLDCDDRAVVQSMVEHLRARRGA